MTLDKHLRKTDTENMLDPVKNAEIIGLFAIIAGVINLLFQLLRTANGIQSLEELLSLIFAVGLIVIGYGLRKSKRWAIYGLGIGVLISLISIALAYSSRSAISDSTQVSLIASIVFFIWFFLARKRFS